MRMEMAFFLAGMTRTPSDQSMSRGTASGSLRTASSICSSVSASSAAQSVLPRIGSYLETIVIFSSLIFSRAARRDDVAECAADRARDDDFSPFEIAEDLVPDFAMTIRSPDENVA